MIEVDGTERLQELADTLESREVQIELTRCPCGEHVKSVYAPDINAEWCNVSLADECGEECRNVALDREADWLIDEMRAS